MFAHWRSCLTALAVVLLATVGSSDAAGQYQSDNQNHPGRSWRVQKTTIGGWGDTDVTKSIADHVQDYAFRRYGLDTVITDPTEIKRAKKDVYDFLSWKYGNPSLVTAQWISAGYKHFDGHVAEAAMSILGTDLEGPGKTVRLPKELSAYLKTEVQNMSSSDTAGVCAKLSGSGSSSSSTNGSTTSDSTGSGSVVLGVTCRILVRIVAEFATQAIDRLGISADMLGGKPRINWKDRDVALALYVRRNPQLYATSNIQKVKAAPTTLGPAKSSGGKSSSTGRPR